MSEKNMTALYAEKSTIRLAEGLDIMLTDKPYLVWNPSRQDQTAWGIWHWHTEGRFRERYAEKLTHEKNETG